MNKKLMGKKDLISVVQDIAKYIRRDYTIIVIMAMIIIITKYILYTYIHIRIYLSIFHIYYIDIFNYIVSISIHR